MTSGLIAKRTDRPVSSKLNAFLDVCSGHGVTRSSSTPSPHGASSGHLRRGPAYLLLAKQASYFSITRQIAWFGRVAIRSDPAAGASDWTSTARSKRYSRDLIHPSADEALLVMNITSMLLRTLARTRFKVMIARKLATNASVAARPTIRIPV